jgi:hypothetical protein
LHFFRGQLGAIGTSKAGANPVNRFPAAVNSIFVHRSSFFVVVRPGKCSLISSRKNVFIMRSSNTFGVHFTLRRNRPVNGKFPLYCCITVIGSAASWP